nr:MAG TPA: Receptor Binding Protein sandwich domain, phage receptor.75A [Caudoviricetes sp.]
MIKGFRFTNQLANAEVDARIHQEFLNKNDGIFYGMNISKTNNSITIAEGLCEIAGRPVAVIDTETVNVGTNTSYCLLILEIDLSKDSTKDVFEQVSFKILESSSAYPSVTQEDINMYNGENNIYQLEFARFRTGSTGIIEFKDTRKFLSFTGIYAQIKADCEKVMAEIKQELANVKDGSDYLLKSTGGTVKGKTIFEGGIEGNVKGNVTGNCSGSSGSCTGNASTATTANSAKGCTRK